MSDLRFYTFVNFYLSSIQQGVQSFHVGHEMFNKYDLASADLEGRLFDWSKNHKTLIILNGGANTDIEDAYYLLDRLSKNLNFPMPFTKFNEDERSLGGIVTACGCVLPQEIYDAVDFRKAEKYAEPLQTLAKDAFYYINNNAIQQIYRPGTAEHELISLLKSCPLAR